MFETSTTGIGLCATAWDVGADPAAGAPSTGESAASAALGIIETVERLKAMLDLAALSAWRALHAHVADECDALDLRGMAPTRRREHVASLARTATVEEVMAATGLGRLECERRLSFATAHPRRTATASACLRDGGASLYRVLRVHDETRHLDPAVADGIAARVLLPTSRCPVPSERLVSGRLRRQLALHAPDPAKSRAAALAGRTADAQLEPEGVGVLTVTGDAARVAAAMDRVEALARAARAGGDPLGRTLAQLRSDVALDLVLYGVPAHGPSPPSVARFEAGGSPGAAAYVAPAGDSPLRLLGSLPPARVHVVVSWSTLAGRDEGLAVVPGHGWLTAAHAREVVTASGSTWRGLLTEPETGRLVHLSTHRYRPTEAIREHVVAHDRVCRAPGCTVDAAAADLDHEVPHPAGATSTDNLSAKHRRHHALKTAGLWTSRGDPDDGSITWRTLAGRAHVTYPHDYRELTERPVGDAAIAASGPGSEPGSEPWW